MRNNMMEINSYNLSNANGLYEYKKMFRNFAIEEKLKTLNISANKYERLYFDNISLEDLYMQLKDKYQMHYIESSEINIIDDNFIAEIYPLYIATEEHEYTSIGINLASSSLEKCNHYLEQIKQDLDAILIKDEMVQYRVWQYGNGEVFTTNLDRSTQMWFDENAVPFISEPQEYIKYFLDSDAPILVLYGEAGTGKSTFAKFIVNQMKKESGKKEFNVAYTSDESIFYAHDFFHKMMTDDYDVLVIEDINAIWNKNVQDDGIHPITKFLSLTDGMLANYKKIIITTNIESKHQFNEKLTRPGRCFDMIKFRKLKGIEIDNLCDSFNTEIDYRVDELNISEFFAIHNGEPHKQLINNSIGF